MINEYINTTNIEALTAEERAKFDLEEWINLFYIAWYNRYTSGWVDQATTGNAIRANQFPLKPIEAAPDWKGKFYKDNWVFKSINWIVAMLYKSRVDIDLTTIEGSINPLLEPLEFEMLHAASMMRFTEEDEQALYDKYYTGEGWIRAYWNTRKKTQFYRTGQPVFEYIDSSKICVDPAVDKPDKSDMRYLFHEEYYDLATVRMRYPQFYAKLQESRNENKPQAKGQIRLITIQYKKPMQSKKIFVDFPNGYSEEYPLIELQEIYRTQSQNAEAMKEYARQRENGMTDLEFSQWLMSDWILPEGAVMSDPVDYEEDTVWQAIIYPDGKLLLALNYVWSDFTYFNLPGHRIPKQSLCYGLAYYLADSLEAHTALMTVLMMMTMKYYIIKELIQKDSLENEEEYLKSGHKVGVNPIVKPGWQKQHMGQKAVEYMDMPEFPAPLLKLSEMLEQVQRTTSGVTEPVTGQQQYAGQAGITVAQLTNQAQTGFKTDIAAYEKFQVKKATWLKDMICKFRNYPHKILGLDENNDEALVDIATNILNQLQGNNAVVNVKIIDNYAEVERIDRELAMAMRQLGLVPGDYVLEKAGINNSKKVYRAAQTETGQAQIMDYLNENPKMNELVQQAMKFNMDLDEIWNAKQKQIGGSNG